MASFSSQAFATMTTDPASFNRLVAGGFIMYGGIFLEIITVKMHREVHYQDQDYLFTRHTLRVTAWYNPQATAYTLPQVGLDVTGKPFNPQVFKNAATVGSITDVAIRHFLSLPRQSLLYVTGASQGMPFVGVVNLKSPDPLSLGVDRDVTGGPFPKVNSVLQVTGSKTFYVDWEVSTDLNEGVGFTTAFPSPLLSNRFEQTHEVDKHFWTTRTTRGTAVFRQDILAVRGLRPDDLRSWLFFPVPPGFQRDSITVRQSPDGQSLNYEIVDRQTPMVLVARYGAVEIEASVAVGFLANTPEEVATNTLKVIGGTLGGVGAAEQTSRGAAIAKKVGVRNLAAFAILGAVARGAISSVPTQIYSIDVNIWGDSSATNESLTQLAVLIYNGRLGGINASATVTKSILSYDLVDRHITAHAEGQLGPVTQLVRGSMLGAANKPDWNVMAAWLGPTDTPNVFTMQSGANNPAPGGEAGRGTKSSRGSYLASLVVAVNQPDYGSGVGAFPPQNTLPESQAANTTLP